MIKSCRDKRTSRFLAGQRVKEFSGFADQARRRLAVLAAATRIEDLAGLPSNRLEMLKGDRTGQYSIRINDQWRICFHWEKNGAERVEICDYH
ncbi:MAG: type II toxin-antitoxin system RelE/ParE family toxin [Alphaproteobacteria bacterium]|nr:type II toxin-antitoxin system RelE/ParE family toxin [Alphaproteobacteria bacterium]